MMKFMKTSRVLVLLIVLIALGFFGHLLVNNLFFKTALNVFTLPSSIVKESELNILPFSAVAKRELNVLSSSAAIKNDTKFILFWTPMWDDETFSFGSKGYEPFKHCDFKNCFSTCQTGLLQLERFDAIVFHAAQHDPSVIPYARKPHQRYIFATMESPIYTKKMHTSGPFYNWTMTYRLDSDIIMSYGHFLKYNTNYITPDLEFVNNKTHLAAWVVSHCETPNKREVVYDSLNKFINIDVYGACGTFKCPADNDFKSSAKCYDYLAQKYKFYLSFENSYCKDYVTEKLYMLLERDIVPIVYGFADYETAAPPHSVINVDKFASIKQLADYILFLDKNPEEYIKYFEWKKYYINKNTNRTSCALCRILNDPLQPQKTYEDINAWWWGKNHEYCHALPNFTDTDLYREYKVFTQRNNSENKLQTQTELYK